MSEISPSILQALYTRLHPPALRNQSATPSAVLRGFRTHEKACQRRSEQRREDLELARVIRQEQEQAHQGSVFAGVRPSISGSTSSIDNRLEGDDFDFDNQMDYQHDADVGRTDSDGDPPPSGTASPAPQHEIDDIKVEYHPSSGVPTKVYHFEDYGSGP
ncbi:hypothetical protein DEU56DRAFT_762433, partial [Suillus clintonianus]|uniref:uncharacterized protein n=1 Tax=Suillus clintonianus TaxID=1904413 RepID=UPI001B88274B